MGIVLGNPQKFPLQLGQLPNRFIGQEEINIALDGGQRGA